MSNKPLMPKATAVWLVEKTGLTFRQIGDFCGLHELEVKGLANEEVGKGIKGIDPIKAGQLTAEEIARGEADPAHRLQLAKPKIDVPLSRVRKGPKYTPLSRRQDRPDAIAWLLRNHPELSDAQIMRLVGTTKPTIEAIRGRSHWNIANIRPRDPVTLGMCSQIELDEAVRKAAERAARQRRKRGEPEPEEAATLKPAEETVGGLVHSTPKAKEEDKPLFDDMSGPEKTGDEAITDADSVFSGLKDFKKD